MPVLKPEIQAALRSVNLAAPAESTVGDILKHQGASLEETVSQLLELAQSAGNENVRFNAIKAALQMHGVLKDTAPPPPSVTIIISDPQAVGGINPVLLPRELIKGQIQ